MKSKKLAGSSIQMLKMAGGRLGVGCDGEYQQVGVG